MSAWLTEQGYSLDFQKRYRKSKWLETVGTGAMMRSGDQVGYAGVLYALQKQCEYTIHPSGKTAFSILGKSYHLELSTRKVTLFGAAKEKSPVWFQKHDWGVDVDCY